MALPDALKMQAVSPLQYTFLHTSDTCLHAHAAWISSGGTAGTLQPMVVFEHSADKLRVYIFTLTHFVEVTLTLDSRISSDGRPTSMMNVNAPRAAVGKKNATGDPTRVRRPCHARSRRIGRSESKCPKMDYVREGGRERSASVPISRIGFGCRSKRMRGQGGVAVRIRVRICRTSRLK